ncbi:hypothetical protein FRC08_009863, partial [Ceratobasidium sp. 394]
MAPPAALLKSHLASNPALTGLPDNLSDSHKSFWNKYIGDPFKNHIGPRGKKSSNARTWTRDMFTGPFCDEFFPELSPDIRRDYEVAL